MTKVEYCVGATDENGKLVAIDEQTFPSARAADRYRLAIGRDDADVCKIVNGRIQRNKAQRAVMLGSTLVAYDDLPRIVESQWSAWGLAESTGDFLQWAETTLGWDRAIVARTIERIGARLAAEQSGPNDTALFAKGVNGQPILVSRYGTEPPDWREARFNAGLSRFGLCGETILRLSEAQIADRKSAYVQSQIAFNPARKRKPITDPAKILRAAAYWEARRRRALAEARRQRDIMTRDNLLARLYNGASVESPRVKARTYADRARLAYHCAISVAPSAPTETDETWAGQQRAMMRAMKARPPAVTGWSVTREKRVADKIVKEVYSHGFRGRSAPRHAGYSDSPECGWTQADISIRNMAREAETETAIDALCEALASAMEETR